MNFSQKLGLFILILLTVVYFYDVYFGNYGFPPKFKSTQENQTVYHPLDSQPDITPEEKTQKESEKVVKIFLLDNSGNLRAMNRKCNIEKENSCFEYAIKELVSAPTKWEKSKGFTSEIPSGTKVLSVRESSGSILIDLSSDFESGGGAESTYARIQQVIKTANANSSTPTYLYINGKQADVIGGEGIMIKQPLSERSFDE